MNGVFWLKFSENETECLQCYFIFKSNLKNCGFLKILIVPTDCFVVASFLLAKTNERHRKRNVMKRCNLYLKRKI